MDQIEQALQRAENKTEEEVEIERRDNLIWEINNATEMAKKNYKRLEFDELDRLAEYTTEAARLTYRQGFRKGQMSGLRGKNR